MTKIKLFVVVVLLDSMLHLCLGRKETLSPEINVCIGRKTCGDCLEADPKCAFCTSAEYDTRNLPRCDFIGNHNGRCPSSNIVYPASTLQRTQDTPVRNADGNTSSAVQIQPQTVNINIRPNDPLRFNLTFRLAEKYPIDLYYLMDLSYSMKDDKDNIVNQVNDIANALKNITDDFRMGFGSFIDKPAAPFSYTEPDKTDSPCVGCSRPYGFKNELKLDADVSKFLDMVRNAQVFDDIDHGKGGSDAIMQVLSCEDQIGWRAGARRLLLVSTDARFHYAADWKLDGRVQRNDGICHLDASGMYTESLNQDYPSIRQIALAITEKDVNLIFAVPGDVYGHYKGISDLFLGSEVGNVTSNSAGMVKLVQNVYRRLTSKVTLMSSHEETISVKFFSNCNGSAEGAVLGASSCLLRKTLYSLKIPKCSTISNQTGDDKKKIKRTNKCEDIHIGETLTFEVEIELKKCPKDPAIVNQTIEITPVGITERATINLSYTCQCDCGKDSECKEVCKQYRPCVECVVFKSGSFSEEECNSKCVAEGLIEQVNILEGGFKTCEFKDAEDCRFYFSYSYGNDDELKIQAKTKKDCPVPVNVLAIVLPTASIVFLVIAGILIYKVRSTICYVRQLTTGIFEKKVQATTYWTGNPLFKPATKDYNNPIYRIDLEG